MKLYPLKFKPILKPVIWGGDEICNFKGISPKQKGIGESWEISHVKDSISIVSEGNLSGKSLEELIHIFKEDILGKKVIKQSGETFPLLIKFIDAKDDLSIQVHPDDILAKNKHNSFGKTEMWYVVNATKGAKLYSGFKRSISSKEYIQKVQNDTFIGALQQYNVQQGDVFFLPAGRVHSIGAGCFIAEIQQTSDITYRIYDYNREDSSGNKRELHTENAKDAIDYKIDSKGYKTEYEALKNTVVPIASCQYFTTNLIDIDKNMERDFSQVDSFVIYICLEGNLSLYDSNNYDIQLKQGDSILIPAICKNKIFIIPHPECKLLETFVGE